MGVFLKIGDPLWMVSKGKPKGREGCLMLRNTLHTPCPMQAFAGCSLVLEAPTPRITSSRSEPGFGGVYVGVSPRKRDSLPAIDVEPDVRFGGPGRRFSF